VSVVSRSTLLVSARRLLRWLAVVLGMLVCLYGLLLFLLGTEDVGGLRVSIPGCLACLALGGYLMWLGRGGR